MQNPFAFTTSCYTLLADANSVLKYFAFVQYQCKFRHSLKAKKKLFVVLTDKD